MRSSRFPLHVLPLPVLVFARVLAVLSSITLAVPAAEYHVSPRGSAQGTGAPDTPFATIAQASRILQPGDICTIHSGTYHETLRPDRSGAQDAPITYRCAGDGAVFISAADAIRGWHRYRGDIYQAAMPSQLGPGLNQIFLDGALMVEARWPHVPWDPHTGFTLLAAPLAVASIDAGSSVLLVPSADQPPDFWKGATVWSEIGARWTAQTAVVTASSPGQLTIAGKSKPWFPDDFTGQGKAGALYLSGTLKALASPGEWFAADGQLWLMTLDRTAPTSHLVEARSGRAVVDLSDRSWIMLRGLTGIAGGVICTGSSCTLQDCTFRFVSHDVPHGYQGHGGITIDGSGTVMERCLVDTSSGSGILLGGHGNVVRGCIVRNVDYDGDYSAAVNVAGSGNTVTECTLTQAGRALINPGGTKQTITYNDISHPLLLTQDGGCFYEWGDDSQGTVIAYNLVHDSLPWTWTKATAPYDGIYLDDGCKNFIVHHNVVWNCGDAIRLGHIHPASGHRIINNTLWSNEHAMAQHGSDPFTDIVVENNLADHNDFQGTDLRCNLVPTENPFVDAASHDFQLRSNTPARGAGMVVPGITDGFHGAAPDLGAFPSGSPPWHAGASESAGASAH